MVSANDKVIIGIALSGGECHDAPEGRKLLETIGKSEQMFPLLMDKAYEGAETRALAEIMGYMPVVPPKSNRKDPWEYDKELYKRRNVWNVYSVELRSFAAYIRAMTNWILFL